MYHIEKILNNNSILVSKGHEEMIVLLKGIGFGKKVDDRIDIPRNAKKYIMQKSYRGKNFTNDIFNYIDPVFLEIASEIIRETQKVFENVDEDILLPLADHIYFAIKRMENQILPMNPFKKDIQIFFPEEHKIALEAKNIIRKYISKEINDDEVGFITLHVHSAVSNNAVSESMEVTRIIHESIVRLEEDLQISINLESVSYVRLMNHIKFLMLRLNKNETLQMDITEFTKTKFPFAYEQSKRICHDLEKALNHTMPKSEIGYLALHLERILSEI